MYLIPILMNKDVRREYLKVAALFGTVMTQLYDSLRTASSGLTYIEIRTLFQELVYKEIPLSRYSVDTYVFSRMTNHLGEEFDKILCVSINECVAHGKNKTEINLGDIVSIDAGIAVSIGSSNRKLYFDAAFTCELGNKHLSTLASAPLQALKVISKLEGEISTRDIAKSIQEIAWSNNFSVVTALTGHGIGYSLHEYPSIPNAVFSNTTIKLPHHIMINPEPMYVQGDGSKVATVRLNDDGWSVITTGLSSHWETTFYYDGEKLHDIVGLTNIIID